MPQGTIEKPVPCEIIIELNGAPFAQPERAAYPCH